MIARMKYKIGTEHASLRIAFQASKPTAGKRYYRELPGTSRKLFLSDARDLDFAVKLIQEAVDSAVQKLEEAEIEIP